MENFEKLLCSASKKCEGYYDEYCAKNLMNIFMNIYPFTTENIAGYIDNFDLKDKSLLTVGSSGDQVLNAIFKCCRDITVIDINPYTKFYYYLKVAGILNFNLNEFKSFFRYKEYPNVFVDNEKVFSLDLYQKLKDDLRILDYESYIFWDELFSNHKLYKVRWELFSNDEGCNNEIDNSNIYMSSEENFNQLKKKVRGVRPDFINKDIFYYIFDRRFDNIWLSNVGSYHSTLEMSELIDYFLDDKLNENGNMLISYFYRTLIDSEFDTSWPDIYDLEKTFRFFNKYNPSFINFTGIEGLRKKDSKIKDAVLIYKKSDSSPINTR